MSDFPEDDDLEDCWDLVRPARKDPRPRSPLEVTVEMGHLERQLVASLGAMRERGVTVAKPWDDDAPELNDDELEVRWTSLQANEFSFAMIRPQEGEGPWVAITPTAYLTRTGHMYDQELLIDHLLPPGLYEAMEGTYEYEVGDDHDEDHARIWAALRARGFVESGILLQLINQQRIS